MLVNSETNDLAEYREKVFVVAQPPKGTSNHNSRLRDHHGRGRRKTVRPVIRRDQSEPVSSGCGTVLKNIIILETCL